jgi:phage baseplate assembly protein W
MQRFKWSMQLASGSLATVEQDSDEDVVQCLKAILMHRPGDRPDIPEMGIHDPTFGEQPLDLSAMHEVLRRHEPRVDVLVQQQPNTIEALVAEVSVNWDRRGDTSA